MLTIRREGANVTEVEVNDLMVLYSYNTAVAYWIPGVTVARTETQYSATTTRHINEWVERHGFSGADLVPQAEIDAVVGRISFTS